MDVNIPNADHTITLPDNVQKREVHFIVLYIIICAYIHMYMYIHLYVYSRAYNLYSPVMVLKRLFPMCIGHAVIHVHVHVSTLIING